MKEYASADLSGVVLRLGLLIDLREERIFFIVMVMVMPQSVYSQKDYWQIARERHAGFNPVPLSNRGAYVLDSRITW